MRMVGHVSQFLKKQEIHEFFFVLSSIKKIGNTHFNIMQVIMQNPHDKFKAKQLPDSTGLLIKKQKCKSNKGKCSVLSKFIKVTCLLPLKIFVFVPVVLKGIRKTVYN